MRCEIAALLLLGLSGCAAQPQMFATIKYVGAKDDLGATKALETTRRDPQAIGTDSVADLGLSTARVCDAAKVNCRSAVVSGELRYKVEKIDDKTVRISGKLITKISRNITTVSARTTQRMGLVDGVESLGETSDEQPVTGVMELRQPLDLKGAYGTRVSIWFEEK